MGNNRNRSGCESWEGEGEKGKGGASLRLVGGGTANLISKSIGTLKEKNKYERECEGGLSAGAFRDPRARCLFLEDGGEKWAFNFWVSLSFLSLNGQSQ